MYISGRLNKSEKRASKAPNFKTKESEKMFELIKLKGNTYYIDTPTKIGLYNYSENNAVLIDTGNDSRIAKRVLKAVRESGFNITAVFCTHCHADHVGGNAYIKENSSCRIFCPKIECEALCFPLLNPIMLYGAYPPKELKRHFFLAEPNNAEFLCDDVLPKGLSYFALPGHTMGMVGYRTDDGVYFLADSIVSETILQKSYITYLISPKLYLETIDGFKNLPEGIYVPSHNEPLYTKAQLLSLSQSNVESVNGIANDILEKLSAPMPVEKLLKALLDDRNMSCDFSALSMIGSAVRSYLSYLQDSGAVTADCSKNKIYWQRVDGFSKKHE